MYPVLRFGLLTAAVYFGLVGLDKQRDVDAMSAAAKREFEAARKNAE